MAVDAVAQPCRITGPLGGLPCPLRGLAQGIAVDKCRVKGMAKGPCTAIVGQPERTDEGQRPFGDQRGGPARRPSHAPRQALHLAGVEEDRLGRPKTALDQWLIEAVRAYRQFRRKLALDRIHPPDVARDTVGGGTACSTDENRAARHLVGRGKGTVGRNVQQVVGLPNAADIGRQEPDPNAGKIVQFSAA